MSRLIFNAATLGGTTTLSSVDAVGNFTIDVPAATGPLLIPTTVGIAGQALVSSGTAVPIWQTAGTGTVTSVSFTGGLISVANPTSTPALTVAGTSGGVPYFNSASTWASSAVLAANALMIGGGAGATPATTATGTGVVAALGVNIGTAGSFVLNGGALGTPSSGTVTNLTGTASININGTVGATTAAAGAFTTLSATGITTVAAGSAALPAIVSTTGTADTGFWFPAADTIAASTAGTERMRIDSAGGVGIGITPVAGQTLALGKSITGNVNSTTVRQQGVVASDVTTSVFAFDNVAQTAASAFTLASYVHFAAQQGSFGAGSAVSNQYGFLVSSSVTGATNNYGFYSDIASGTGRFNFYAAGTASNYFEGSTFIGGLLGLDTKFAIGGTLPSSGTASYAARVVATIPSTSTGGAIGFDTTLSTQAAAYTLSALNHYNASQGTIGAGSTVTNQYGFIAQATLTGATNNYGFYGNIASGTGRWNFYAAGTAQNYFGGNVGIGITTPAASLSVGGSIRVGSSDTADYSEFANNGTSNYWNSITDPASIFAGGSERVRIATTGTISLGAAPGSESLRVTPVASAVNYFEVQGAITSGVPIFRATGSDTNVPLTILTKGTGYFNFQSGGGTQFFVGNTASAVNYLQVTGGATGVGVALSAQGSDANIINYYSTKGTGAHSFFTGGGNQFTIANVASAVNSVVVYGSATGTAVQVAALGSDTNIDLTLTPKGTGNVRFGTLTVNADAPVTGYILIKDSGGTTRKLAVIA